MLPLSQSLLCVLENWFVEKEQIFVFVPAQREQESSDLDFLAGFNMTKGNIDD